MTYLSVCSGIEAVSVAWEPLGFRPIGFSEIEPFPCELLKQKYPNVKNYGDITQYEKWNAGQFDILVGGTPCQSFSVAGKRGGTADERGALMYAYLGIVEAYSPRWVIWENVPGVLSSNSGYDFTKYYLSRKACAGILRRAAKHKRKLPTLLEKALTISVAEETSNITKIRKLQH